MHLINTSTSFIFNYKSSHIPKSSAIRDINLIASRATRENRDAKPSAVHCHVCYFYDGNLFCGCGLRAHQSRAGPGGSVSVSAEEYQQRGTPPLYGANPGYFRWSRDAIHCYDIKADCQNCYISKMMGPDFKCQMAKAVVQLLTKKGPPPKNPGFWENVKFFAPGSISSRTKKDLLQFE